MVREKKKIGVEERLRELTDRVESLESVMRGGDETVSELITELRILRSILLATTNVVESASAFNALVSSYDYGDIAHHAVEALLQYGPLNVSQLTDSVKRFRGTASRRIVAEKLKQLEAAGIVEKVPGKKSEKLYRVRKKRSLESKTDG